MYLSRRLDRVQRGSVLAASRVQSPYLIPELLGQVGGLVQRETGHQPGGEDVLAAQLVDHIGHIEERVICQQLPATQRWLSLLI